MSKDYTSTLNLPSTSFAMRANLPQREPEMLKYWDEIDLYSLMLKNNEGHEKFVLHDGPPFSNGDIHMGTAMNKILKDMNPNRWRGIRHRTFPVGTTTECLSKVP